jgi:hypothetical protein
MEVILTDELLDQIGEEYQKEDELFKSEINFFTYLDAKICNINCDINRHAEY